MKHRPAFQLRYRGVDQFVAVQAKAAELQISMNEWILIQIESSIGQTPAPAKVVKAKKK